MRPHRQFCVAGLPLVMLLTACGSASTTITSPATERCAITLNSGATTVPAGGGLGTIGVAANRECTWSATVEGAWLGIRSGASGQGEGTVEFTAAANAEPAVRSGAIVVNGSRAQITQAAGECVITLASSSVDFPTSGGATQVDVRASSALCSWTAVSDAPWITITSGASGRGTASVGIVVAATTGPPRTGSVTIAGQHFSVSQSQGCTYSIDRTTHATSSAGGSATLAVTTAPACPWKAASNTPWIAVNPSSGSGPGVVAFDVGSTQGPARTGTAVVAGQVFTITQSAGCGYDVQPVGHDVPASGGSATVTVATSPGCEWTATSSAPWITIQGAAAGTGPGQLTFAVAAAAGPARSGTLTVAGHQVTVNQTQGCTFGISPQSQSVPAAGGSGKVAVAAGAGCAWTATSGAQWIAITSGASGNGNGEVQFSVTATAGPPRSAPLTIAGQTFTVTQGTGCSVALSAERQDVASSGGTGSVGVLAGDGCGWTAESTAEPWLTITSDTTGTANGTVGFTVARNDGPPRQGTLLIAGRTFTVNQAGGCSSSINPLAATVGASGGQLEVDVSSGGGCSWTAESNADWIVITSGMKGENNGKVRLTVGANSGPDRSGTVAVAGHVFTVTQAGGCSFTVAPEAISGVPASGETRRIEVATVTNCSWTAAANVSWITLPPNPGGTGSGAIDLAIAANTDSQPREGTVTIAGRTVIVSQQGPAAPPPCVITLTPTSQTVPRTGGTGSIAVSTGATCTWTAVASHEWIRFTGPLSGTGNGTVQFSVDPAQAPRTGTITIGNQVFTINQQ